MAKQIWKAGTMIYPVPAVLVSCGTTPEEYNILTVSWTGTICTTPPMCYVSIRPERHSYEIIKKNMEFVINLTTKDLLKPTDWCGVVSGRDFNKFKEMNLTPEEASVIKTPVIKESPINIECVVKSIQPLGSHDMFVAEIKAIMADEEYLDKETGAFDFAKARLICYSHGLYHVLGDSLGKFGYSISKKKPRRRKIDAQKLSAQAESSDEELQEENE